MKELSIEEKAKAYDEALERARNIRFGNPQSGTANTVCEEIFPELKEESEDERIREQIVYAINKLNVPGSEKNKLLAWLEKQGEQKPIIEMKSAEESLGIDSDTYNEIVDECIYGEQKSQRMISAEAKEAMYDKPSDKIEPKFKVSDWVVYYRNDSSREVLQVYDIRDGRYYFTDNVHFSWSVKECDEKSHLWTIQDAKEGDVLACENGWTCIFKCLNDNLFSSYCFMDHEGWFCEDGGQGHTLDNRICGEIYPATNEQCDTLIKAMADAGYTFDFDKRELKKIEQKSAEWSEEDEKKFADACIMLDWYKGNNWWTAQYIKDWLKSLKDRYTWKPSDAQMASIICAVRKMKESACYDSELVSLLNDLKKLREE